MSSRPLIVTSLPPRMSRRSGSGADIGEEYQISCIESWWNASFSPISVGSIRESYRHSIKCVTVARDAFGSTGRHHVYIEDLLSAAVSQSGGRPFAIANADIFVSGGSDLSERVLSLRPGEVLISRRTDIDSIKQSCGNAWPYGYDFFALHPDDLGRLSTKMVFGAPWWDHFLPLLMYMRGCRIVQMQPGRFHHLVHEERWSWDVWLKFGRRYVKEIESVAPQGAYRSSLRDVLRGDCGGFWSDLKFGVSRRLPWNASCDSVRALHRVSELNLSWLDRMSLEVGADVGL